MDGLGITSDWATFLGILTVVLLYFLYAHLMDRLQAEFFIEIRRKEKESGINYYTGEKIEAKPVWGGASIPKSNKNDDKEIEEKKM